MRFGVIEPSIIVLSIEIISFVLQIPVMPDFIDTIPEQNRWEADSGSMRPRAVIIWPTIPATAIKVEESTSVIQQIVGNSDRNIHTECRRINKLRRSIQRNLRR